MATFIINKSKADYVSENSGQTLCGEKKTKKVNVNKV